MNITITILHLFVTGIILNPKKKKVMANKPIEKAYELWNQYANPEQMGELDMETLRHELEKKLFVFYQPGPFYYYVFNIDGPRLEFISPGIKEVLGYETHEATLSFLLGKIHPQDLPIYVAFETETVRFLHTLPKERMFDYKVRMDFRIRKKDDSYARVLYQAIVIEQTPEGKFQRSLGMHTDITFLGKEGNPGLSFFGMNGAPSYLDVRPAPSGLPPARFSKRELEILRLLVAGKTSLEIASLLSISKMTVDTHRKNLLNKNDIKKTSELIATAIKEGWV